MSEESKLTENKTEKDKKPASRNNNNGGRKITGIIILLIILTAGGTAGYYYWKYLSTNIITDNAYVKGHLFTISSRIDGTVKEIYVRDNMPVKQGDILVKIDPADYEVTIEKNRAALEVAKQEIKRRYAAVESAKAQIEYSKSKLELSKIELNRAKTLYEKAVYPKEKYDLAQTNYNVAVAQVKADEENLKQAEAMVSKDNDEAIIREKAAELRQSELDYEYTSIYSPADGYITKKSVETGNRISEGQPLFAIIPLNDVWIEANFKENQVEKLKPGMKADIEVDTFPDMKFSGHIESIMAGTGGAFSLLPPENATGNWVKVVQRIPVKILLDKDQNADHILRVGMSCNIIVPLSE